MDKYAPNKTVSNGWFFPVILCFLLILKDKKKLISFSSRLGFIPILTITFENNKHCQSEGN